MKDFSHVWSNPRVWNNPINNVRMFWYELEHIRQIRDSSRKSRSMDSIECLAHERRFEVQ